MTLLQLKYITMVADMGSIREAAKQLFISQPALTKAIQELENEIQLTIFTRTNKGICLTNAGSEFLGYAKQVLQQSNLLEEKYKSKKKYKQKFSISTQHYSFAVDAFVDIIKAYGNEKYDFSIRETQTYEILEDVKTMRSEIGILYMSKENETVLSRMLKGDDLKFEVLFTAKPHVFISSSHPLANYDMVSLKDLEKYPYLCFEQGSYNSFYFAEEILSTYPKSQQIQVRDRATLFNLAIGLDGYTFSTGVISKELNGENIIAKPLDVDEVMHVGMITHRKASLSRLALAYIEAIKNHI